MILGLIFFIAILIFGISLVNGKDSEANGQTLGAIVLFFVVGLILAIIMNALLDGCTK